MPANVEGGLALFVSALQGSLAAGSAAGGVIYDANGPGGALVVAAPSPPLDHSRCWAGSAQASALRQQAR